MTTNVMLGLNFLEFQPCQYHQHVCVTPLLFHISSVSHLKASLLVLKLSDVQLHLTAFAQYYSLSLRSSKPMKRWEAGRTVRNGITALSLITYEQSQWNYKAQIMDAIFLYPLLFFCFFLL